VWARLRVLDQIRISRKRGLRIRRESRLLSPYRCRKATGDQHTGHIITQAPSVTWGTDRTRILAVDDAYVWLFTRVEHWNTECIRWQVAKYGNRYAALEPISMGLGDVYGDTQAGVARGLPLRLDHGTQYLSDHFLNQTKYWGINASFAFVSQPETNGVTERFNRTLKEQAIYERVFQNIQAVLVAVGGLHQEIQRAMAGCQTGVPLPGSSQTTVLSGRRSVNKDGSREPGALPTEWGEYSR